MSAFSAGAVVRRCSKRRSRPSTLALHSPWGWICGAGRRQGAGGGQQRLVWVAQWLDAAAAHSRCRLAAAKCFSSLYQSNEAGAPPSFPATRSPPTATHLSQRFKFGVAGAAAAAAPRRHPEHRLGRHLLPAHRARALLKYQLRSAVLAKRVAAAAASRTVGVTDREGLACGSIPGTARHWPWLRQAGQQAPKSVCACLKT